MQNPWDDDTDLFIEGVAETGYWAGEGQGTALTNHGDGWHSYTFTQTNKGNTSQLRLVSWPIPGQWSRREFDIPSLSTIFDGSSSDQNSAWIYINQNQNITISLYPVDGTIIMFLNPWVNNSPKIIAGDSDPEQMERNDDFDGWYSSLFFGSASSALFMFTDYFETELYTSEGMRDGDFINVSSYVEEHDTVWIMARPYPNGTPVITIIEPEERGERPVRFLSALIRDWKRDPAFGFLGPGDWSPNEVMTGMVLPELDENGRIQRGNGAHMSDSVEAWFETREIAPGRTNDTCINLEFRKDNAGRWYYDSWENDPPDFLPINDFNVWDEWHENSDGTPSNFLFTTEMHTQFVYREGGNQEFFFRGDDDVWVFINGRLAIDLGGFHQPAEDSVNLDDIRISHDLEDGGTYQLSVFHAERKPYGSNFMIRTSIDLRNDRSLFYSSMNAGNGRTLYEIFEFYIDIDDLVDGCGFNLQDLTDADTIPATVDFFISGPEFGMDNVELQPGTHFGGLTLSENTIMIDSAAITGLASGSYTVTFVNRYAPNSRGTVTFTVPAVTTLEILYGAVYADSGDGSVNRLEIHYLNDLETIPDSVILFWPSRTSDEYRKVIRDPENITLNPSNSRHVTVILPEPFPEGITTYRGMNRLGTHMYHPTDPNASPVEESFQVVDSVGPLIAAADIIERFDSGLEDVILISFTENITSPSTSLRGKTLELIKSETGSKFTLDVINATETDGLFQLTVRSVDEQNIPRAGDSLRFNPGSEIYDLHGVPIHELNRPVVIGLRAVPPEIDSAFYFDTNADGIVDQVLINFNKEVNPENMIIDFQWGEENIEPQDITHHEGDNTRIAVQLTTDHGIRTSGRMIATVYFTDFNASAQGTVRDRAAAVLLEASYIPGGIIQGERSADTLMVIFSEPMNTTTTGSSTEPFSFISSAEGEQYSLRLNYNRNVGNKYFFEVEDTPPGVVVRGNDSVYINPGAELADGEGNIQNNSQNRRVPLVMGELPIELRAVVFPNPCKIGEQLTVRIESVTGVIETELLVSVGIYDKLGNLIFSQQQHRNNENTIDIQWDLRNRNNRYVAEGTYLIIINAVDAQNRNILNERIKAAINRQ
ncbi:fibro-slime family protein [Chitinispirillum alkaliphilum]|nr:fibro-slime family protein [Chitinispirillum alkaliphilum]